ncbi:hypothetical protein HanPSC8_Chr11g0492191 [Helianthus annuus]|nr:hypothetical protein HanPSC8_Chr11g0492191 [Helianthus annuus]
MKSHNFIGLAMHKELLSVQFNFMSLRCMKRGMANASEQSRKLPNVEQ